MKIDFFDKDGHCIISQYEWNGTIEEFHCTWNLIAQKLHLLHTDLLHTDVEYMKLFQTQKRGMF